MASECLEEFYRKSYEFELDRMHKIDGLAPFNGAIIVVLTGPIVFFLQALFDLKEGWWTFAFVAVVVAALGSLALSITYLKKSHSGLVYQLVSNPLAVGKYADQLRRYYEGAGKIGPEIDDAVEKDVKEYLSGQYQLSATANRDANHLRYSYRGKSELWMFVAIIATAAALYPYHQASKKTPPKMQLVTPAGGLPVKITPDAPQTVPLAP